MPVEPVGPSALDAFIELPFSLHADDPAWVPPLRQSIRTELDGSSPFFRYGRAQAFVTSLAGHLRGRIAALMNDRLVEADGAPIGQVGYFECVDEPDVARDLFAAAFDWLRAAGARRVIGPMNGGVHRSHRLLVRGFERSPFLLEPRNPEHYPRRFAEAGFSPIASWCSLDTTRIDHARLRTRFSRLARGRFTVELPDPTDVPAVLTRLYPLLDRVWGDHFGYARIEPEELAGVMGPILPFMRRGELWFLRDPSGADLGYAMCYPDLAPEVRALGGDASGWGRWAPRLDARLVLHTVALVPEVRGTRGTFQMVAQGIQAGLADGIEEHVWALLVQPSMPQLFRDTREYSLYGRPL